MTIVTYFKNWFRTFRLERFSSELYSCESDNSAKESNTRKLVLPTRSRKRTRKISLNVRGRKPIKEKFLRKKNSREPNTLETLVLVMFWSRIFASLCKYQEPKCFFREFLARYKKRWARQIHHHFVSTFLSKTVRTKLSKNPKWNSSLCSLSASSLPWPPHQPVRSQSSRTTSPTTELPDTTSRKCDLFSE